MFWKKTSLSFHFVLLLVYAADSVLKRVVFRCISEVLRIFLIHCWEKMPLPFKEVMLEKEALTYLQEKTGYR